jgi:hydrogenase/urease accessory protein HupE
MNEIFLYLHLGYKHIIDLNGSDHILFILALIIRYSWNEWQKILILVTAFTIGHSITLALSTLDWISFPAVTIELLIPITILITAFTNFRMNPTDNGSKYPLIYYFTLFFGLIHGLGFSNYLKMLLGKEESILMPLFSFNLGLELGQILIVIIILIISVIFVKLLKLDKKRYVQAGSVIAIILALYMVVDRIASFF